MGAPRDPEPAARRARACAGCFAVHCTIAAELIRGMAVENRTWGAERIRGELRKLGIRVANRTIQLHIRIVRPPTDGQRWRTFLKNQTVWACDFLQVYDVWFRPIFAFFIVDVNSKRVVQVAVTRARTQQWTAQQLWNATPFRDGPRFIIRDRDDKFGPDFDRAAAGAGHARDFWEVCGESGGLHHDYRTAA